jgi:hypothetical protein
MSFDGPVKATLVRFESARVVEAGFVDGCGRRGTVSTYATNARMSGMLECGGKDKAEASEREAEELLCGQPAAD